MKRKPVPTTPAYEMTYSRAREVDPDSVHTCSVIALSIATGINYDVCRQALEDAGLDFQRGAFQSTIWKALRSLGFTKFRIEQSDIIARYPPAKRGKTQLTTRQVHRFPKAYEGLPPCLVFIDGHVAALSDGRVHDWSRSSSHRVSEVFAILPSESGPFTLPWGKVLHPAEVNQIARRLTGSVAT